jgi:Domain of unknown function (DUF4412)
MSWLRYDGGRDRRAHKKEAPLRIPNRSFVIAALVSSAGAFAAAQDLTIVSRVTHDGGAPETATSYLSSERIRMAHGEGREAMVDYKLGQMISIDHRKKTYSITTQKDIDEFAARMQEQMNSPEMRQAREAMKDLPPEQRKAIEGFGAGLFEVEKVGTSRKIAGYACENWTVTMGKLSRSEECLTTELKFPVQTFDMYKRYMESMRGLMASMSPMGLDFGKMTEQFKKMRGYPLAVTTTTDIMGRKTVTSSEVVEIKRTPIPASAWEIPAGYTKVENSFARGLEGRRKR